jgi:hypothetical protein
MRALAAREFQCAEATHLGLLADQAAKWRLPQKEARRLLVFPAEFFLQCEAWEEQTVHNTLCPFRPQFLQGCNKERQPLRPPRISVVAAYPAGNNVRV